MAETLYETQFQLFLNGFDITNAIKPFLLSITLEDSFDTNFTQSKIDLVIHSGYQRASSNWKYKDTLKIDIWWKTSPSNKFISSVFYIDYIENTKSGGGNQTYRVSGLEANLDLGFSYGFDDISYINTTALNAVTNFSNTFGLSLTNNIPSDVYLGSIEPGDDPTSTFFLQNFTSYAELLRYICNTFSFLGNLSGDSLTLIAINTTYTDSDRFFVDDLDQCLDFNSKQTFNPLSKEYSSLFVNRDNSNTITEAAFTPKLASTLNNKIQNTNEVYYNLATVTQVLVGKMYKAFLQGFEATVKVSASPNAKAGQMFLLNASYGNHEGYYRCTKVLHQLTNGVWTTELKGFPIKKLDSTVAYFDTGYSGRVDNPTGDGGKIWNLNEDYGVRNYNLGANKYNEFAKHLNPNYDVNLNLGALFLQFGNDSGYDVDPAVIFCMTLVMSNNYRRTDLMDKFNPMELYGLGTVATFPDFSTGIKAACQHFYAYAHLENSTYPDLNPPELVDPRFDFVTRGIAPFLSDLNGKWTAKLDFSEMVISKIIQFYEYAYPDWKVNFTFN